jgi:hypothetical protein
LKSLKKGAFHLTRKQIPTRVGYKLTHDAECLYDNWLEIGGCTCFLGCAPCRSCTDEGNPLSLEENDEAWEIDEEVEDMSRSEIINKGGTQPEDALSYTLYVKFKSSISGKYEGKEYAYKCTKEQWLDLVLGSYVEVDVSGKLKTVLVTDWLCGLDPKATKSIVRIVKESVDTEVKESKLDHIIQVTINRDDFFTKEMTNYLTTKEESNMTNVTRRVVNVKFFDEDAGLDVADSLVAFYDNIVTQDSDESTVRELLMNLDVAAKIVAHNEVRAKTVDLEVLRNTGNEVMLRPIKLKDLRIEVTKA